MSMAHWGLETAYFLLLYLFLSEIMYSKTLKEKGSTLDCKSQTSKNHNCRLAFEDMPAQHQINGYVVRNSNTENAYKNML